MIMQTIYLVVYLSISIYRIYIYYIPLSYIIYRSIYLYMSIYLYLHLCIYLQFYRIHIVYIYIFILLFDIYVTTNQAIGLLSAPRQRAAGDEPPEAQAFPVDCPIETTIYG